MRYSDQHRFFFVHIPKCAGRSIGKAIEPVVRFPKREMAQDTGLSVAEIQTHLKVLHYDHPVLGPLDPYHIPLPPLRKHFPRTFDLVETSASFAVVREPRDRFLSALTQRMKEYLGYTSFRLEDQVVRDEAKAVCEWLDGRNVFTDMEYVHFTRQIDYVEVDGRRVVDRVFPMQDMAAVTAWVGEQGFMPEIEHGFERRQPKSWFKVIHPATRAVAKALPTPIRKVVYPLWMKSGLFASAAAQYSAVELGKEVESFISDFYSPDRVLWDSAQSAGTATTDAK